MGLAPRLRSAVVGKGSLNGSRVISLARDRTYATIFRGGVVVQGTWAPTTVKVGRGAKARRVAAVELGPEEGGLACPTTGLYRWKRRGATMTFTKARDACEARRRVLAETGPWSVVGG